jgi:hypothetical protein
VTALSPETACAILASHGAEPARWPAAERAALLALAGSDPKVAAALTEARALDAMLDTWATAPAPLGGIDAVAMTARPQWRREQAPAWRPALLAASLALVVAVGGWLGVGSQLASPRGALPETEIASAAPPSAAAGVGEADLAFAYVFTPTAAEEDVI